VIPFALIAGSAGSEPRIGTIEYLDRGRE